MLDIKTHQTELLKLAEAFQNISERTPEGPLTDFWLTTKRRALSLEIALPEIDNWNKKTTKLLHDYTEELAVITKALITRVHPPKSKTFYIHQTSLLLGLADHISDRLVISKKPQLATT